MDKKNFLSKKLDSALIELKNQGISASIVAQYIGVNTSAISKMRKAHLNARYYKSASEKRIQSCLSKITELYSIKIHDIKNGEETNFSVTIEHKTVSNKDLFFIYYHTDNNLKVRKSLLVVSKKNKNAQLRTFNTETTTVAAEKTYFGVVNLHEDNGTSIFFSREQIKDQDISFKDSPPSFVSFESDIFSKKMAIGVYASSQKTSCGIVVLKKTNQKDCQNILNSNEIPSEVLCLVSNARFDFYGDNNLKRIIKDNQYLIKCAREREGVYEGYTLSNRSNQLSFQRAVFEFYPNGNVRFKSLANIESQEGRITEIRRRRNIIMQFSYQQRHRYYCIQILLDMRIATTKKLPNNNILIGCYGGIEEMNETPMAGRLILIPSNKTYDELDVIPYPIADGNMEEIEALLSKEPHGNMLKSFFRGELDGFVDPPNLLEKCPALVKKHTFVVEYNTLAEFKDATNRKINELVAQRKSNYGYS